MDRLYLDADLKFKNLTIGMSKENRNGALRYLMTLRNFGLLWLSTGILFLLLFSRVLTYQRNILNMQW